MPNSTIADIIQWDIKAWSKALNYWDSHLEWSSVHDGLELGGRQGGLSLWLALKGIKTVCSDLHQTESTASALHTKYNVKSVITYQDIDATNIPYENHFDVVVLKSILGGIGSNNNKSAQQKVLNEIHKALKPGGKLLFAENLKASPLHSMLRKKFVSWGSAWRYITLEEMKSFLSCFSSVSIASTGFLSAFGRTEMQRSALASLDRFLINKICPSNWKYICYGIAEK